MTKHLDHPDHPERPEQPESSEEAREINADEQSGPDEQPTATPPSRAAADTARPAEPTTRMGLANTYIDRDGTNWVIATTVDGVRKIVSRHASEQLADLAFEQYRVGVSQFQRDAEFTQHHAGRDRTAPRPA